MDHLINYSTMMYTDMSRSAKEPGKYSPMILCKFLENAMHGKMPKRQIHIDHRLADLIGK